MVYNQQQNLLTSQYQSFPSIFMGNSNQINKQSFKQVESCEYLIHHPILQSTEILFSKNVMKTNIVCRSLHEIKSWKDKLKQFQVVNQDFLLLPLSAQISQQAICGDSCSISILFKCFPYVLIDQIKSRKQKHKQFEQDQIWYVIWALADSTKKLMDKGTKLGDIRPHNIFLNETGDIKITTLMSWPNELTNFEKTYYQKTITYLSPQQLHIMNTMKGGSEIDCTNFSLSQSFSIGLTLLSILYLLDFSQFYQHDIHYYGINYNKLKQRCQYLSSLNYRSTFLGERVPYSLGLIELVRKLCCQDFHNRINILNVWNWLKPFQKDIISFKPFKVPHQILILLNPNNIPNIIHSKIVAFLPNNNFSANRFSTPAKLLTNKTYQSPNSQFSYSYPINPNRIILQQPQFSSTISKAIKQQYFNRTLMPLHVQTINQNNQAFNNFTSKQIHVPIISNKKIQKKTDEANRLQRNKNKFEVERIIRSSQFQNYQYPIQKINVNVNSKINEDGDQQKITIANNLVSQDQNILDIVDRQLSKSKRLFPPTSYQ